MKSFSLLGSLALLAPLTQARPAANSTSAADTSWWLANLDHTSGPVRGFVPFLKDSNGNSDFDYPVWISVNPGDSQGFIDALYSNGPNGQRDNCWAFGQPRVVYLPPGTYTVSSTVFLDTGTIIQGDATNPPTIMAAAGFSGDTLIVGGQGEGSVHPCGDQSGELHFSVVLKNVILDTTSNAGVSNFNALSWSVGQNCALVNVEINMPQGVHTGIVMGGGSTISVDDTTFRFGAIGLHYNGHQQAQIKGMRFQDCTRGIVIDGGFTISIIGVVCDTVGHCITLNSGNPWVAVIDGQSINSGDFFTSVPGFPNFMLENIVKDTTNSNMVTVGGSVRVGGSTSLGSYVWGNTYDTNPIYQSNPTPISVNRPAALAPGGNYPVLSAPQYPDLTINDVINLKDSNQNGGHTLLGDGSSDDTAALQAGLNQAASQGKLAFLPHGVFCVTSTITIPDGTRLYGEAWAAISACGGDFSDEANPRPVVQIGDTAGQVGKATIQDIRITVREQFPGAILLRVNMAGASPGDVAIFNCAITIGGTRDTSISCFSEASCRAANIGLHLASGSSAYVQNVWDWVSDHNLDDSTVGTRVAVAGGILVEATAGTWLMGCGAEHNWLFQLALHNAENVFIGFFQSETNYHQGFSAVILPGNPFNANEEPYFPNFSWCGVSDSACRMSVNQYYVGSNNNIWHYAAAAWNFVDTTGTQQLVMNYIHDTVSNPHLHGYTSGPFTGNTMKLPDGKMFGQGSLDGFGGSWMTLIANIDSQS